MIIAPGVMMLELESEGIGGPVAIHPTLIWDEEDAILIDTGMPGDWIRIQHAMQEAGVPLDRLHAVLLTHQDLDHIGSLPDVVSAKDGHLEVIAHHEDAPYIEGKSPLIKTSHEAMAKLLPLLPEEQRPKVLAMCNMHPSANVTRLITDNEVLPYCGGIHIIHTPGHTAGHVSIYLERSRILIAGDAMISVDGMLQGPVPHATLDMDSAIHSLSKLAKYPIDTVICYHGGLSEQNIHHQILQLSHSSITKP
ncbi:MBL fold metallo-hydrolase [Paenibacillus popilliae]|uniref:MBL fold metallo-hydrolase n=1 Tax=Paenibacillus popilliae TaxID=78057 RepID=A0ABY3ATK9_PAEPP|nr:MBL fold metallo-hydrolase [Paenibacillus sp. SDF0028]TQR44457.1 MBL fold metallo-hydrolase [Paenibacillus sp. SDF0028]